MVELPIQNMTLIQQGAEAKVYKTDFVGRPAIAKVRFLKKYRLPELDEKLTHKRITQEARTLSRCRDIGIKVPAVYFVDMHNNALILAEVSPSVTLKEHIYNTVKEKELMALHQLTEMMREIGHDLAKMHNADIVHGDLTTSNILVRTPEGAQGYELFFIDFGLSSSSRLAEDKGVDIYVLEKAFLSTHPNSEDLFGELYSSYLKFLSNPKPVKAKFEEIKLRGRKRTMVG